LARASRGGGVGGTGRVSHKISPKAAERDCVAIESSTRLEANGKE
jgi:hypothetical protein